MARETVHSASPVSDFFNDAKPRCEGGVAFCVIGCACLAMGVAGSLTPAQAPSDAA